MENVKNERKNTMLKGVMGNMIPQTRVMRASKHVSISNDPELKSRPIQTEKQLVEIELQSSYDRDMQKILSGKVWGTRASVPGDKKSLALVLVSFKNEMITIPANEFFPQEVEKSLKEKGSLKTYSLMEMESLMSSRNNSIVDFIVTKIIRDENGEIENVLASRKAAMERERRNFWFAMTNNQRHEIKGYYIHEGTRIPDARIVCSTATGIIAEVKGVEFWIPNFDLTHNKADNIRTKFPSGASLAVEITKVERNKVKKTRKKEEDGQICETEIEIDDLKGDLVVMASHKKLTEDARKKLFSHLQEGDEVLGRAVVTGVKPSAGGDKLQVFVKIDDKLQALCFMDAFISMTPAIGQRVDFKVKGKNEETGLIWGYIFHVYSDPILN